MTLCDYLGEKTGELQPFQNGKLFVYECNHPEHTKTTIPECLRCQHSTVIPDPNCIPCQKNR